ncbi:response regulator [Cohnella nanjingensis]|uniref:Response regulator n=1 Tax=Cohnella nanjingensis TaxID=1387779 RepID=A0A7X0RPH7_9BACL|nr:response regulator [Cohnella nanjingensis]MBB6669844.1 response regulator [Cohnella nanjingensis]
MIRAYLADDEEHALNLLELLLARTGDVEVIGRCGNGFDAFGEIGRLQPDVAFLDIEMPGMNGVELAEKLGSHFPDVQIVFVTAYDRYAISAFERDAVDYLLKPLEMERLTRSVQRVKREVARLRASEAWAQAASEVSGTAEAAGPEKMLRVQLLGETQIVCGDQERLKWRTAKEKELFAYFAVHHGQRIHRDVLLDELWPEENYQKSKVYLHTCVSYLRRDLRQLGLKSAVVYEEEKYYLDPNLPVSDYQSLRHALIATRAAGNLQASELEGVLALYAGPLLRDEDYHWAETEIRQLETTVEALRLQLGELYEQEGDYGKMTETARLLLKQSPYNEEAYRLLMRGCSGSGKLDEVFRAFEEMTARLGELRISPSEVSRQLYRRLTERA